MGLEQWEQIAKKVLSSGLNKVAEDQVPTAVMGLATRPVMQHALRTTYVEALKREILTDGVEHAVTRAGTAAAVKGAGHLAMIGKVAGPVAGAAVNPLVEIAQVAYEDVVKGEERTGEDYKNAAIRGTVAGAAGAGATAWAAFVFGVFCPPAAPFIAAGAGIAASGVVSKLMKDNE